MVGKLFEMVVIDIWNIFYEYKRIYTVMGYITKTCFGVSELLDGWETLFVALNGSLLFIRSLSRESKSPKFAPFIAPSIHHWIEMVPELILGQRK